jgi:hypothetical protein
LHTLDKITLVGHDELVDERSKSDQEDLGDELTKAVNQTYWPEVCHFASFSFLSEENHVRLIKQVEASEIQRPEGMQS